MPSQRTRVLGLQLYETNVKGFLHWGFNFYNSGLSYAEINPYAVTNAGGAFPPGDGFIVYAGKNGVNGSIRLEAINDGFQDYRALRLLESLIGREKTMAFLNEKGFEGYQTYPRCGVAYKQCREEINAMIKKSI